MGNKVDKIYQLDEVLEVYVNKSGISTLLNPINDIEISEELGLANDFYTEEIIDEIIDEQLERDLLDDIDVPINETKEEYKNRLIRYQRIVNYLKQKYDYKCQICGYSFLMDNGKGYCEAHHIKMLSENGSQSPENVIILCANHHRMFHYASSNIFVGDLINGKRVINIGIDEFNVEF